jgi:ArsR family transcriptional regulator
MKKQQLYEIHASICKALTHPIRLEIIDSLRAGKKFVSQLAEELGHNQGTVSRHLHIMHTAHIIQSQREGQCVYYSLSSPRITIAYDEMHEFTREFLATRADLIAD